MSNPKGNIKNLKIPKKGDPSPNPNGRPPDMLNRALKKLSIQELEQIGNIIVKGNVEQLKAVAADPTASVIKVMVASIAIGIIKKNDMSALDKLLDRLLGKVKQTVQVDGMPPANAVQIVVSLPDNGFAAPKDDPKD